MSDKIKFDQSYSEICLLTRLMQDPLFSNTIKSEFDNRWIKSKINLIATKLILAFQAKYKRALNLQEFSLILNGAVNKDNTLTKESYSSLIKQLTDNIKTIRDDMLTDITNDFVRRQATWCAIIDNVNEIENNPEIAIDKCLDRLNDVQQLSLENIQSGLEYFNEEEFDKHFDAISNPEKKLSTGWRTIDEVTHGGFYQDGRCLSLIAAQAGLGKSIFLSNLAVNFLKQEKCVVVISLEMSENVYAQRFDAHISNMDINELVDNGDKVKSRLNTFKNLYPKAKLFIKEFPPHSVSSIQIDRYLKDLVEIKGIKPDVLIVDYLNLVKANNDTGDSLYLEGVAVSEQLRALSYSYQIPVISAVQVNTAGMNNADAGMQNISNSRGIAMTCDYLHIVTQSDEDQQNGILRVKILKNRFGGQVGRKIPFRLDPSTLILTDMGDQNAIVSNNDDAVQDTDDDLFNVLA